MSIIATDRPKFKEIAYNKTKKGIKINPEVEEIYDTVELKMDCIWGVFICNLEGKWRIESRTGKIKKEGHTGPWTVESLKAAFPEE